MSNWIKDTDALRTASGVEEYLLELHDGYVYGELHERADGCITVIYDDRTMFEHCLDSIRNGGVIGSGDRTLKLNVIDIGHADRCILLDGQRPII